MTVLLVWGCEQSRQYEADWIKYLLSDNELTSLSISEYCQYSIDPSLYDHVYLVESGLLRLHRNLPIKEIKKQHSERLKRFKHFSTVRSFTLIHLSDEEGLDARSFILPFL